MIETHRQLNEFAAYTMTLLRHNGHYLMLKRAADKSFAPGKWTGIGGRVEADEFHDLRSSALREIAEETGIVERDLTGFVLRRSLLVQRPEHPLTILLYFTGEVASPSVTLTDEGSLQWVLEQDVPNLDIIDNTQAVIPYLIADMVTELDGMSSITTGAASYTVDGELNSLVWSE